MAEATNPKAAAAFQNLLRKYYEITAMEEAYATFTDTTQYDKQHKEDVEKYTAPKAFPNAPPERLQANVLAMLGPVDGKLRDIEEETYFVAQFTSFKRLGLITSLNVKWSPDFQHSRPGVTLDEVWNMFNGQEDFQWDQNEGDARTLKSQAKGEGLSGYLEIRSSQLSTSGLSSNYTSWDKKEKNAVYFLSPSILNYLARKGVSLKEQNHPNEAKWYLDLYSALMLVVEELLQTNSNTYPEYIPRWPTQSASKSAWDFVRQKVLAATTVAELDNPSWVSSEKAWSDQLEKGQHWHDIHGIPGVFNWEKYTLIPTNVPGATGDEDGGGQAKKHFEMLKRYYTGNQGKGTTALLAVDTAINNFINNVAKLQTQTGIFIDAMDFFANNYAVVRRNKRIDTIRGWLGISAEFEGGDEGAQNLGDLDTAVVAKILKVAAKKQNLVPMDFQCFLLEQIRFLSSGHKSDYKHIMKLSTARQPGLVKNKLYKHLKDSEIKALLQMCPSTQSLLVPYLKISRVDYDEYGKPKIDPKTKSSERPLKIPNFLSDKDMSAVLKGNRAAGAGIKSFTWSLDGVQPAEVDNNISATLELYFQSVSDFFRSKTQAGDKEASYLDLVISSPGISKEDKKKKKEEDVSAKGTKCKGRVQQMLARKYEGANYRIKVVAGWGNPGTEALQAVLGPDADPKTAGYISAALEKSKISLFLQQTRHMFQFNQDGSLTLSIDYQASLTGILVGPTADILGPSGAKIAKDIEAKEKVVDKMKKDEDKDEEKYKEELEELKKLRGQDKLQKYKKVLGKVYDSDHIYALAVNPEEFLLPRMADLTPKERAKRAKRKNSTAPKVVMGPGAKAATKNELQVALLDDDASAEEIAETAGQNMTMRYDKLEESPGNITYVPFMFLGDLLDAVLSQMEENHEGGLNLLFFLSEVEMIDPLMALQVQNIGEIMKCGQDIRDAAFVQALTDSRQSTFSEGAGITQLINIGDIPISLDAFQVWYKDYVVKRDRDKYYFLHFVKDICAQLISKALASKCFGPDVRMTQRFDAQPITVYKTSRFGPNKLVSSRFLNKQRRRLKPTTAPRKVGMGLVLLSTDSKPKGLNGNYNNDLGQGVYHHYLGAQCGLVKTINFNREEQPYLRESKIQKAGALGAEQLRELYSAEMELYGNTLYKNGQYVYINPRLVGATKDQLTLLGLHGYYLITSVSSTVTENSFDVSVKALHEGIEFGSGNVLLEPETYGEDLAAEREPQSNPASARSNAEQTAADAPPPATVEERTEAVASSAPAGSAEAQAISDNFSKLDSGEMDPLEYLYQQRVAQRADELGSATNPLLIRQHAAAHNLDPYVQEHPDLRMENVPGADTASPGDFTTGQP